MCNWSGTFWAHGLINQCSNTISWKVTLEICILSTKVHIYKQILGAFSHLDKKNPQHSQVSNKRVYLLNFCNVELFALAKAWSLINVAIRSSASICTRLLSNKGAGCQGGKLFH